MSAETKKAIIKHLKNVIASQTRLEYIILSFFGGEPMLYYDSVVRELLEEIHAICSSANVHFNAHMTTNGLLLNENMLTESVKFGLSAFQITLDGNREQHNQVRFISETRGSFDKIAENIKLAVKLGCSVNARINCSENTFYGISDIVESFIDLNQEEKSRLTFDFQKVWQEKADISELMTHSKKEFEKCGFLVSKHGAGSVIESCYADKRYQATFNYNGEVFKCTARDFTNGSGEGQLNEDGNIVWNEKYERRLNSKFSNEPCKTCRILPLCGGGCTQAALEAGDEPYCVMSFDEDQKTKLVKEKFELLCEKLN